MKLKMFYTACLLLFTSHYVSADVWKDFKKAVKNKVIAPTKKKIIDPAGEAVKDAAQTTKKFAEKEVINPSLKLADKVRRKSIEFEYELAKKLNIKVDRYNFTILNATARRMDIELKQLDTLQIAAATSLLPVAIETSLKPSTQQPSYTLKAKSRKTFHTPDKTLCWKTAYAIYKNNQGKIIRLQLKKDDTAKCKNFIAAIVSQLDKDSNPIKDTQGNELYKVLRGKEAKEYIENYKAPAKPEFLQ